MRKVFVVVLALAMLFTSSVVAFAEGENVDHVTQICEAYGIQADDEDRMGFVRETVDVYEAYAGVKNAINELDEEALHDAMQIYREYDYLFEQLSEEQYMWLGYLMGLGEGTEYEVVLEELEGTNYMVESYLELSELASNIISHLNLEETERYIELYEETYEKGEVGTATRDFFEEMQGVDLDDEIVEVKAHLEELNKINSVSENTQKVYRKLNGFYETLKYGGTLVIEYELETYPRIIEVLENLSDAELAELAGLLGVANGEEAKKLYYEVEDAAYAILEMKELYVAFEQNPTEENAKALAECYDKASINELTKDRLLEEVPSIEEAKTEADKIIAEAMPEAKPEAEVKPQPEAKPEAEVKPQPEAKPETEVKPEVKPQPEAKPEAETNKPSEVPVTGDNLFAYISLMIASTISVAVLYGKNAMARK